MTENKYIDAAIIIILLTIAVILSIITPSGPNCVNTGRGDSCTAQDFKEFKK